ncbi:TIM barrel protein [Anaerocolumna sedimenticola]|uniref:D-psicose 3-epimerase n=1 Tax=Anaerocolumna sedimenticola TaxID=2696063 RepID=A0A6P1TRF3_9FIRM|nr:sugar phosphate isomerase/epimerase family protein [Anaerocolumna sedimenticola]QHQ62018.1 TIM barrel protein [Anaerocolumna sedimenticola]
MQHGIYYAYWEKEWAGDYLYYIKKVAKLGFDILEIAAGPLPDYTDLQLKELKECAEANHIRLTVGYGPSPANNIASSEEAVHKNAMTFYTDLFKRMRKINATLIGGAIYSCWPIDYSKTVDKKGDWGRGVEGIAKLSKIARECGVETLGLEVLNRFENHVLNTAEEGVQFVKEVRELDPDAVNVKVMLDTFHMNIEEQSIGQAIRTAGAYLGHFHTGECNRMVPGKGRTPWREIGEALRDINYNKTVVMEPFVRSGGQVGQDIKIWREIIEDTTESSLDKDAKAALEFQRYMLG